MLPFFSSVGWNSSSVWCDFSPFCIGPGVLCNKSIFLNYFSFAFLDMNSFSYLFSYLLNVWSLAVVLQLRVVRAVAVLGGLLQIVLFMCLCGATASVCFWLYMPGILFSKISYFVTLLQKALVGWFFGSYYYKISLHKQYLRNLFLISNFSKTLCLMPYILSAYFHLRFRIPLLSILFS